MNEYQPVSWPWLKAVLVLSLIILAVTSAILLPLEKLFQWKKLTDAPNWVRWMLVLPTAFLMGMIAEILPRVLFAVMEIVVNHELLFRPGFESLVWQLWSPLIFVAAGIQMAPAHRFATFVIVGGLKITVAATNLFQDVRFVHGGGQWSTTDPITHFPIWWNAIVYTLCIATLGIVGYALVKLERTERSQRGDGGLEGTNRSW